METLKEKEIKIYARANDFLQVQGIDDLAKLIQVPIKLLLELIEKSDESYHAFKIPKKRGCIAKGEGSHKECARRTDACPHGVGGADGDRALGQPEQSSTDEHAEDRYDEPDPSVFWAVCDF